MTMKKIFKFALIILLIYLVVQVFVYILTKTRYFNMNNYTILTQNPSIEITESKVSKHKGYIKGNVVNNTNELIKNATVKFDFYSVSGEHLGSEYHKIGLFNVTEKSKFDIRYQYENVGEIRISIISQ